MNLPYTKQKICYLIANFGGPRNLTEVRSFLESLLTDRDVLQTGLPTFLHNFFFKRIARKRAIKISHDYQGIGGKSPIYEDTEAVVALIKKMTQMPVIAFHRYLPATHAEFLQSIQKIECDEIRIFPMFPQFTYATTGSIARWFNYYLPAELINKMRWIKSYAAHPSFIRTHQNSIRKFLKDHQLKEEETVLLFSAHGVPEKFIRQGDVYQTECIASFQHVMEAFPQALGRLSYQSKFGREEWIKPYTIDVCKNITSWNQGRPHVVFVPISFTSDHIETLFEIEKEYMTEVRSQGLSARRIPGLTLNPEWIQTIVEILMESNLCSNQMLIRH